MRLLTWNVQWCRGVDRRVDPERIAAEIARYDPDVACLQEVAGCFPEHTGQPADDQPQRLLQLLPAYRGFFAAAVDMPGPEGRRSRFGNLILSRLPLGRAMHHSLPWPSAPDSPSMPRAVAEAVVSTPLGELRILTTHLEYYLGEHRSAQVERLRALHGEACAPRKPIEEPGSYRRPGRPRSAIVCGDFNLPPHDPLRKRMQAPFEQGEPRFVDAWEHLNPGRPHPPTFRLHERKEGVAPYYCDYVFVTDDLAPRLRSIEVDGANQASDHQPVIATLR